jgi:hypothetical protein
VLWAIAFEYDFDTAAPGVNGEAAIEALTGPIISLRMLSTAAPPSAPPSMIFRVAKVFHYDMRLRRHSG